MISIFISSRSLWPLECNWFFYRTHLPDQKFLNFGRWYPIRFLGECLQLTINMNYVWNPLYILYLIIHTYTGTNTRFGICLTLQSNKMSFHLVTLKEVPKWLFFVIRVCCRFLSFLAFHKFSYLSLSLVHLKSHKPLWQQTDKKIRHAFFCVMLT